MLELKSGSADGGLVGLTAGQDPDAAPLQVPAFDNAGHLMVRARNRSWTLVATRANYALAGHSASHLARLAAGVGLPPAEDVPPQPPG